MRTPAGIECAFFYGNYFRGRSEEECRLIGRQKPPDNWTSDLCATCPVPGILRANACPNMVFTPKIQRKWLIGRRQVEISVYCSKSKSIVDTPQVGCGYCHSLNEIKE